MNFSANASVARRDDHWSCVQRQIETF